MRIATGANDAGSAGLGRFELQLSIGRMRSESRSSRRIGGKFRGLGEWCQTGVPVQYRRLIFGRARLPPSLASPRKRLGGSLALPKETDYDCVELNGRDEAQRHLHYRRRACWLNSGI